MANTYRLQLAISPFFPGEMTTLKIKTSQYTKPAILRLGRNVTRILYNKYKKHPYFKKLTSQPCKT